MNGCQVCSENVYFGYKGDLNSVVADDLSSIRFIYYSNGATIMTTINDTDQINGSMEAIKHSSWIIIISTIAVA